MPWGEELVQPKGRQGPWRFLVLATALTILGYQLYAMTRYWRRERNGMALAMLLSVVLFSSTVVEGVLARSGLIDFVQLGPFGFLAMAVIMSMAYSRQGRLNLQESERRYRSLVEQSPFSIQVFAPDGRTRHVNPAWEKLWGVKFGALANYNILEDQQLVDKGIIPYIEKGFSGEAAEIPPVIYNPADNSVAPGPVRDRWVRAYLYPIRDSGGVVRELILMHEDVTERQRHDAAILDIAAGVSAATGDAFFRVMVLHLAKLFDAKYAFIALLDAKDSTRATTIAVSQNGEIVDNLSYCLDETPCAIVVEGGTCVYPEGVATLFPRDTLLQQMGAESYVGTPLFDTQGKPIGLIDVLDTKPMRDIDRLRPILEIFAARAGAELHRARAEEQIRRMAYYDYLTGLPNRALLHEELRAVLVRARGTKQFAALLLIDLDHFKTINDALSHEIGDEVLRMVASRLTDIVGERVFLSRLGGDEFVALTEPLSANRDDTVSEAQTLAEKVVHDLSRPLVVGDRVFNVGASVGAVLFPDEGVTDQDILRHADMALYRAKRLGRGNVQFYIHSLQAAAETRLRLEDGLRGALANSELALHFQPQVDALGQLIGAEVLLRWNHPEIVDTSPTTFIPVAEEMGLIQPIGAWVLNQACARLAEWSRAGVQFTGHLSINVSPWQFARPDFVDQVREAVVAHGIDPGRLMLELTESVLLYDLKDAVDKLKALRAFGLRVALDDFGTGYSSLAYLRDLPLDQLKIDKTFISELDDGGEHPLVETMIAIGRHMKLAVIAEGVETQTQHAALTKLLCDSFQGYLFCRPLPEKDFLQWVKDYG